VPSSDFRQITSRNNADSIERQHHGMEETWSDSRKKTQSSARLHLHTCLLAVTALRIYVLWTNVPSLLKAADMILFVCALWPLLMLAVSTKDTTDVVTERSKDTEDHKSNTGTGENDSCPPVTQSRGTGDLLMTLVAITMTVKVFTRQGSAPLSTADMIVGIFNLLRALPWIARIAQQTRIHTMHLQRSTLRSKVEALQASFSEPQAVAQSLADCRASVEVVAIAAVVALAWNTSNACSVWHSWRAVMAACFFVCCQLYWSVRTGMETAYRIDGMLACLFASWFVFSR